MKPVGSLYLEPSNIPSLQTSFQIDVFCKTMNPNRHSNNLAEGPSLGYFGVGIKEAVHI